MHFKLKKKLIFKVILVFEIKFLLRFQFFFEVNDFNFNGIKNIYLCFFFFLHDLFVIFLRSQHLNVFHVYLAYSNYLGVFCFLFTLFKKNHIKLKRLFKTKDPKRFFFKKEFNDLF